MQAAILFAVVVMCSTIWVTTSAVPIQLYKGVEPEGIDVVVVGTPPKSVPGVANEQQPEDWNQEQEFTEGGMGKRSIALGRSGFRPGKRSVDLELGNLVMKRSMAIGRIGLRPGKRSMSFGRLNFRPGKRSMAYGRQGFRPGKRSVEIPDFPYQPTGPELIVF